MDVYCYLDEIEKQAIEADNIAKKARSRGLDPTDTTEIPFAMDF